LQSQRHAQRGELRNRAGRAAEVFFGSNPNLFAWSEPDVPELPDSTRPDRRNGPSASSPSQPRAAEAADPAPSLRLGGVVLCGGRSSRMGREKAWLPFGTEPMLARVVRLVRQAAEPVVVVAGPAQTLPPLPDDVLVARDEQPYWGPLGGLAVGLERLAELADVAFVASCDCPLLLPEFVRHLAGQLDDHQAAVPFDADHHFGLAAVYRVEVAGRARRLLAEGRRSLRALLEECDVHWVSLDSLRRVDPQLLSLRNVNTPDDYRTALKLAGLAGGEQEPGEQEPSVSG